MAFSFVQLNKCIGKQGLDYNVKHKKKKKLEICEIPKLYMTT